jgi:hypothetical protein
MDLLCGALVPNNTSRDFKFLWMLCMVIGVPSSNEDFHWTSSDNCVCLQTHLDKTWLHQKIKCALDNLDYYYRA